MNKKGSLYGEQQAIKEWDKSSKSGTTGSEIWYSNPLTVAVIDTKNLFGVAITDAAGQYPHNLDYYPNHHGGNSSRWCRTEFLFNLGRFIPPIMLVSVQ